MSKKTIIIVNFVGIFGVIVINSCNSSLSPTPSLMTDAIVSPIETNTPLSPLTKIYTKLPVPVTCPWIAYFYDGESVTSPDNNEKCLDGLKGIRISEDSKKISFFVNRSSSLGTYGVCRDISGENDVNFNVFIRNNIVSTRFLVMVGTNPAPTKKVSFGFRIQPQIQVNKEQGIWVKFIEFTSDDFENDKGGLQAIRDWELNGFWKFNFIFQFRGLQASLSMNKKALSRDWPLTSSSRYLCLAYQQTPTPSNASEFEAQVNFP